MKALQVTLSKIVVSANPYAVKGYVVKHAVRGVLPRCRKTTDLFISTSASGSVWVSNLWGQGQAHIHPKDWIELVNSSPVVSDDLSPISITSEIEADARKSALRPADAVVVSGLYPCDSLVRRVV